MLMMSRKDANVKARITVIFTFLYNVCRDSIANQSIFVFILILSSVSSSIMMHSSQFDANKIETKA